MTPSNKARYAELCQQQPLPLHLQPWWLDAVCAPGRWDVALHRDGSGRILGALPYYLVRHWGLPAIQPPPFSAYGGPWLRPMPQAAPAKQLAQEHRSLEALLGQLPRTVFFRQNLHPALQNWLPFHWQGYQQTTRYTYLLPTASEAEADQRLHSSTRNKIRHAMHFDVAESDDLASFWALLRHSYRRKGYGMPLSQQQFQALHAALRQRDQCTLLLARLPGTGAPCAAYYLTRHGQQAALLASGQRYGPDTANLNYRMIWECLRHCARQGLSLDLEGSMDQGLERVFRAFGGQLTPFFTVWKTSLRG